MRAPLAGWVSRVLVGWHPRRWRERYGEEMLDVLDQHHPTARTVVSLWASVVGAQLDRGLAHGPAVAVPAAPGRGHDSDAARQRLQAPQGASDPALGTARRRTPGPSHGCGPVNHGPFGINFKIFFEPNEPWYLLRATLNLVADRGHGTA